MTLEEKIKSTLDYCSLVKSSNDTLNLETYFYIETEAEEKFSGFSIKTDRTDSIEILEEDLRNWLEIMQLVSKNTHTETAVDCMAEIEKQGRVIEIEQLDSYEINAEGEFEL